MAKSKIITYIVVAILIILGLYWGYGMINKDPAEKIGGVVVSSGGEVVADDQINKFVSILDDIDKIDLQNRLILSNSIFTSLKDFGKTIEERGIGRANPFAPLTAGTGINANALPMATPATDEGGISPVQETTGGDARLDILGE